jgi:tetratricopeptide (TPR) repeat protein
MSLFRKNPGEKSTNPAGTDQTPTTPAATDAHPPLSECANTAPAIPAQPDPASQPTDSSQMPMLDEHGRQVMVPRAEWRERVLLPHLAQVRGNPDELASTIMQSLTNGFLADMEEPAEHLARSDANKERGAVILSVVHRELGRTDSAESVLREYIGKHGTSANVVVNLGLVHAARGDTVLAEQSFWRALDLDPNHPEAFGALLMSRHKQGGDEMVKEALVRIGALPGNWRSRMVNARAALDRKEVDAALGLYREAIALAGKPVPLDLLMQMTGDLGHTGHPDVMLREAAQLYAVEAHGLQGAHNLFRACLETGQLQAARGLLDLLFAQVRFDWRAALGSWESDLARARMAHLGKNAQPGERKIALLVDDGPIWLPPRSLAAELFEVPVGDVPSIAFIGSSADSPAPEGGQGAPHVSDTAGRFSRAVPLFLAEQIRFSLQARVRPIAPWIAGEAPAFVVARQPWTAAEAAEQSRSVNPECGYAIVSHIQVQTEPWTVEARLVRVADAAVLGSASAQLTINEPEAALRALAADVIGLLQREAGIAQATPPADYVVPAGRDFGLYLLCLERLHCVRCHALPNVPEGTLMGERDVLDGALHLCITQPTNLGARLILSELLRLLCPPRPSVVAEYGARIELLQKDKPLNAPARDVVQGIFGMVYGALRKL